jgi:biopolymer transport protein ExbD
MAKFRKGEKKEVAAINTAALPDIVFMLLFFFMVTTVMRSAEYKVRVTPMPEATEVKKLEKKSLVSYIFVGVPNQEHQDKYGRLPRIQLNDKFSDVEDIQEFIIKEREQLSESDRQLMTVSLKVQQETKMGVVTDIKQALRRAKALKINYSTRKNTRMTFE